MESPRNFVRCPVSGCSYYALPQPEGAGRPLVAGSAAHGSVKGDVTVVRFDVARRFISLGHDADGNDPAGLLAECPAEILAHVARQLLPLSELVAPALDDDALDAVGLLDRLDRLQLRARAPDVHQRRVRQLLAGKQPEVGV